MALEAYTADKKNKVVLVEDNVGIYVYFFKNGEQNPSQDLLQDTWKIAKQQAYEDFNIVENSWNEVADPDWGNKK